MSGLLADPGSEGERRRTLAVRRAVVRFTVSSVAVLLVLILGTVLLATRIAIEEGLGEARARGSSIANQTVAPLIDASVRARAPGSVNELATAMGERMRDGSLLHVTLWSAEGEVIWADQKHLVGRRFPVAADVKALFGTEKSTAEISALSPLDSRMPTVDRAVKVYAGTRDSDQVPMVLEASFSGERIRQIETAIIDGFLPVVIAVLLLFQLAVLPLVLSLARRVERGVGERSRRMRLALLASDLERRRIAEDLHDDVIQDLAGISYVMPTLRAHFAADAPAHAARERSRVVSQILTRDVAVLRSMLVDIHPPDLLGPGLAVAVQDLARRAQERGVAVQVYVAADLMIPVYTAHLAYRVVSEGLRNASKYSQATTATVDVHQHLDHLVVSVSDNGRSDNGRVVQPGSVSSVTAGGLGLRILEETVREAGGRLSLRRSPSGGALLFADFPILAGRS